MSRWRYTLCIWNSPMRGLRRASTTDSLANLYSNYVRVCGRLHLNDFPTEDYPQLTVELGSEMFQLNSRPLFHSIGFFCENTSGRVKNYAKNSRQSPSFLGALNKAFPEKFSKNAPLKSSSLMSSVKFTPALLIEDYILILIEFVS